MFLPNNFRLKWGFIIHFMDRPASMVSDCAGFYKWC